MRERHHGALRKGSPRGGQCQRTVFANEEGLAPHAAVRHDAAMAFASLQPGRVVPFASALATSLVMVTAALSAQVPGPQQRQNALALEASPYLRQHQHDPVNWLAWSRDALAKAAREEKPIFLSIGYSACHWCHVMAAESFQNVEIAKLLNERFICIKVDREERPDIDEIYMTALQAMGQQGGWPLSAWLTPAGQPFFAGTYFPPTDSGGRPGFRRVCEQLDLAWRERRDDVLQGAGELTAHLRTLLAPVSPPGEPTKALLEKVLSDASARFDREHGGFGTGPEFAPKFPSPNELLVLLGLREDAATNMVVQTLQAMAAGGIHDQLGGGFHRYATDRQWRVPHFEKMAYDNALLAQCYTLAFLRTGEARFAAVARSTLDYLLRELRDPRGGFWSSQDSQSDGGEGKFFVWSKAEIDKLLDPAAAQLVCEHHGVTAAGNWEGTNILAVAKPLPSTASAALAAAHGKLLAARQQRVHPGTDDKVLAAWNGMVLRALANGYRVFGEVRYREAARGAADFLVRELIVGGRLRRTWHGGTARHAGTLEDYAALADGLLALFEVDADPRWLTVARSLLESMHAHFAAPDGGYWFTADDAETLVARSRTVWDGATPSGAGLAARAWLTLGALLGDRAAYERGLAVLRCSHGALAEAPSSASALVAALQFHIAEPRDVVIVGEPADERTKALLAAAWAAFADRGVVTLLHAGNRQALQRLSAGFEGKTQREGVPTAYVCRFGVCDAPITDPALLGGKR